jgi:hypothetical protein
MELPKIVTRAAEAAAGAGGALLRHLQRVRLPGIGAASVTEDPERTARRWRVVTLLCSPEQVGTGQALPAPLAAFGDRIEIRVTPAPGDKGTELAARFPGRPSDDYLDQLHSALRQAKQLIEVGEVLRIDPQPHGNRKRTPQSAVVKGMTEQAPKEGVL